MRIVPMGSFARGVAVLGGGTGLGYALVLAVSPVVTRLYTPADFGVLGVYMSIVSMGLVVISWRYEFAIPAPEEDEGAVSVLVLALGLAVGMSSVIGVALLVAGDQVVRWLDAPGLRPYLWLIPLNTVIGGAYGVLHVWCVRKKAFGAIAQSKLSQAVGAITIQVGLGLLHLGPLGLLLAYVVRWGGGGAMLFRVFWREGAACLRQVSPRTVLTQAMRYRRFPLLSLWSALLGNCGAQLPILLLSAFFGNGAAGLYVLTSQVLWAPLNVVAHAISQVFFSNASEAGRKGQTAGLTLRVFTRLAGVGTPFIVLLMLTAPRAFAVVFGPAWSVAGVYAQFLCPWLLVAFATGPVTSLVYVLERQHGELIFQASLLVGRVATLLVGGVAGDPGLAIALFGAVSVAMWVGYLLWLLRISGNRPRDGLICLARNLGAALPVVLPVALAELIAGTRVWFFAGLSASGAWATVEAVRKLRSRER